MSEQELNNILARIQEPAPSTEAQDHALKSALAAFDNKAQEVTLKGWLLDTGSIRNFFASQRVQGIAMIAAGALLLSVPYLTHAMTGSIVGAYGTNVSEVEGSFSAPSFSAANPPFNQRAQPLNQGTKIVHQDTKTSHQESAQTFNDVSANIVESSAGLPALIETVSYLLGLCITAFGIRYFYKKRKQKKDKKE